MKAGIWQQGRRSAQATLATATTSAVVASLGLLWAGRASAYERYNDGCETCHGAFDGPVSPKGTVFPNNDKHYMHRNSAAMATNCNLCHVATGYTNPYLGLSAGTATNPGVGCTGCHGQNFGGAIGNSGAGLRKHHAVNGVTVCVGCHSNDPVPLPENVKPTYYGTVDTKADDPCNSAPGYKENWSVGDTEGLDNDGDNLYDGADPNCAVKDGDLNCDGVVNAFDIDPFVLALTNPAAYQQQYPNCNIMNADINDDGAINAFDIDPFVVCLTTGNC